MTIFQRFLLFLASPFYGKGYVDKYFPFLIKLFKLVYSTSGVGSDVVVDIPLNLKLIVKSDDIGVGIPLITKKAYEPLQTGLFLDTLKAGQVIFDIGANIGYYALLASKKIGSDGKVYAFEPDKNNIQVLVKNIELNNLTNIDLVQKAISDKTGFVNFKSSDLSKGDSAISANQSTGSVSVPAITFDDFVKENNTVPDVIKMDVEGAEILVLRGAKQFFESIQKPVSLFIEYNPQGLNEVSQIDPMELIKSLEFYGFDIKYIIDERKDTLIDYSANNLVDVMKTTTFCNLFAIRN